MRMGFWTGNTRRERRTERSEIEPKTDRFLNFTCCFGGELVTIQFFNQTEPGRAARMLRQMADKIDPPCEP